ncbi:hypothetical protein QQS21_011792 [Conoideocrella luteorostrata]|uniref:Heterokaryon incompatibility domain-containing protein n=1 Tax=Conoideocrella luteorostrata TaxID=1105319 RepID=A0AAJ0CCF4_9HYPO|nr:hypothetical protein QQS21_011792 [Conoideocrella luteorostrata]
MDHSKERPRRCNICKTRPLQVQHRPGEYLSDDQHDDFFHAPCESCDGGHQAEPDSTHSLCDFCSHLRLRHYLTCLFADHVEVTVPTKNLLSSDCTFCAFLRRHIAQIGSAAGGSPLEGEDVVWLKPSDFVNSDPATADFFDGWPLLLDPKSPAISLRRLGLTVCKGPSEERSGSSYHGFYFGYRVIDQTIPSLPALPGFTSLIDWDRIRGFPFGLSLSADDKVEKYQRPLKTMEPDEKPLGWWKSEVLPLDFRCIDVLQECVVKTPKGSPYVTLSYVWGQSIDVPTQATTRNLHSLSAPRGLNQVHLAKTISDAMSTCRELGQRYLWVDRLCIVQDGPDVVEHLDAMGSIYGASVFTIIAADGEDAEYGLPGVQNSRKWSQDRLILQALEFLTCGPRLDEHLKDSKWATRGWTFQEEALSNCRLYFTHFGLYYTCSSLGATISESPASPISDAWPNIAKGQGLVRNDYSRALWHYSGRSLTYSSDFLRAFSGMLFSMYGPDTLWGLSCRDFDVKLLWVSLELDQFGLQARLNFPTWSWASSSHIFQTFVDYGITSVALWVSLPSTGDGSPMILEPVLQKDHFGTEPVHSLPEARAASMRIARLLAALICREGCIRGRLPSEVTLNQSASQLALELQKRWPHYLDFWREAFAEYNLRNNTILQDNHRKAASVDGRILVHTQLARFYLEPIVWQTSKLAENGGIAVVIRDKKRFPAGIMFLSEARVKVLAQANHRLHEFIALSAEPDRLYRDDYAHFSGHSEGPESQRYISHFAGCPCNGENALSDPPSNHIALCPFHEDFNQTSGQTNTWERFQEIFHNVLMYQDADGKDLLENVFFSSNNDNYKCVAALHVMLIEKRRDEPCVAKRIGLGRIYLKNWIEAKPGFETLVLA